MGILHLNAVLITCDRCGESPLLLASSGVLPRQLVETLAATAGYRDHEPHGLICPDCQDQLARLEEARRGDPH